VPEQAYLLRLLFEAGVFKGESRSSLLRFCAGHFSSKTVEQVSFGSLKNNYNDPSPVAISFVRGLLWEMLEHTGMSREEVKNTYGEQSGVQLR
jgi:hypothetical protein